jgi:hypothetical protein
MKLLTHNMLMSPGTRNGFPLAIEVEKMEEVEAEFNAEFMARMVEKLDYGALLKTVASVFATAHRVFSRTPRLHEPSGFLTRATAPVFHARSLRLRIHCQLQCQTNTQRTSRF